MIIIANTYSQQPKPDCSGNPFCRTDYGCLATKRLERKAGFPFGRVCSFIFKKKLNDL